MKNLLPVAVMAVLAASFSTQATAQLAKCPPAAEEVIAPPKTPLEPFVAASDHIVIGKVVEFIAPQRSQPVLADGTQLPAVTYQRAKVELERVLLVRSLPASRPASSPATAASSGTVKTIEVIVAAPDLVLPQQPAPAAPAFLKKGASYLLLIAKLQDGAFYLPGTHAVRSADKKGIDEALGAAEIRSWAWGKASGDLQMCLLLPSPLRGLAEEPKTGPGMVVTQCWVVLLNTGRKDATITVDNDNPITIEGKCGDKSIHESLFRNVIRRVQIPAGGMAMVNSEGLSPADAAIAFLHNLTPAEWSFTARYVSKEKDGPGQLESGAVKRQVKLGQDLGAEMHGR